jgi:hypothetical protein
LTKSRVLPTESDFNSSPTEVVPLVWTAKPISISGFQPLV